MEDFIIQIVTNYGYIGVFLLITLENVFPPIPSEVILLFSGFMIMKADLNIFWVVLSATLGSLVGAIILYMVGRIFNHDRLMLLVNSRLGKILRFKEKDIEDSINWFNNKGNKTVFFCRFIPIVRSLISIPAGISRMKFYTFLPLTFLGSLIWNTILIYVGKITGDNWHSILGVLDTYKYIMVLIMAIIFLVFVIIYLKKKKIIKKASNEK